MSEPQTPYYDAQRGDFLPLPPHLPARYTPALPALQTYTARSLGRAYPAGRRDSAGRWFPADSERRPCCDRVRPPSRRFPHNLLNHCCTAGHCAALHGVAPSLLRGLLAYIARYYAAAPTAPALCPVCGASWACEHRPAAQSDTADMDSLSAEEARRMVDRQIAAHALPADGQHCARCGRTNVLLLPAMVDRLPRWLCRECREWPGSMHEAAAGYRAA